MTSVYLSLASLLIDVESELRQLRLWQAEPMSAQALASTQPFALDTMNFPQWLQFIFLPRLTHLATQGLALPGHCSVAPMAEQYFSALQLPSGALIGYLSQIDGLITRANKTANTELEAS